jgi:hypothetical protein
MPASLSWAARGRLLRRRRALLQRPVRHLERQARGGLLAGAAAAAAAEDLDAELGHQAFDLEFLAVGGAVGRDHVIGRQRDLFALQEFLQQGLGVLAEGARVDRVQQRDIEGADRVARAVEAAVEEDRAEQGFERIGQDRRTAETARLQFALAQAQELRQLELLGDLVQRLLLDQVGAQARQVAFGRSLKRSYRIEATTQLRIESPRNSRRSLCRLLWLRWVSACCSRLGSRNV